MKSYTRVQFDEGYVCLLGQAMYVYAYYEWGIIYMIQYLKPASDSEFVSCYCRDTKAYTSGGVLSELKEACKSPDVGLSSDQIKELEGCIADFEKLIGSRNALVHAHPATDGAGDQILVFQANQKRPIPDMSWTSEHIKDFIKEVDDRLDIVLKLHEALRLARKVDG